MRHRKTQSAHHFATDRGGNVAMIFALVLVPVIGVVSLSIDYGRMLKTKSLLANAGDAALQGIVGAGVPTTDQGELEKRIRVALDVNLPEDLRGLPFVFSINEANRSLSLTTSTVIPTAIMAMVGVSTMSIEVNSTVRWQGPTTPQGNSGPMIAGRPTPADVNRAAEQLSKGIGAPGQRNGGAGVVGGPAGLSAADAEALRQAMQNPEVQRIQQELEARMRDAMARARR